MGAIMHAANYKFWQTVKERYPSFFTNAFVAEFGSYNVNGSVRPLFSNCTYVGIDWRPGPNVDVVGLAHQVKLPYNLFDTVISASMLEHDPYWKLSLTTMIRYLAPSGILLLSWGAAENPQHELETAPDGCFHALPAGPVLLELHRQGIHLAEFHYEDLLNFDGIVPGGVCLVGFKDKLISKYHSIDSLRTADIVI